MCPQTQEKSHHCPTMSTSEETIVISSEEEGSSDEEGLMGFQMVSSGEEEEGGGYDEDEIVEALQKELRQQGKQYGLKFTSDGIVEAARDFREGEFVCEFEGDVKPYDEEAMSQYAHNEDGRFFFWQGENKMLLDASETPGAIARYIKYGTSHYNLTARLQVEDGTPRVYFFARRFIRKGEKLELDSDVPLGEDEEEEEDQFSETSSEGETSSFESESGVSESEGEEEEEKYSAAAANPPETPIVRVSDPRNWRSQFTDNKEIIVYHVGPKGELAYFAVRPSNIEKAGLGLFALRSFRPGERIGVYSGTLHDERPKDTTYTMQISDGGKIRYIEALDEAPYMHMINDSYLHGAPNAKMRNGEIVATQSISPGDEITMAYGPDYWAERGVDPEAYKEFHEQAYLGQESDSVASSDTEQGETTRERKQKEYRMASERPNSPEKQKSKSFFMTGMVSDEDEDEDENEEEDDDEDEDEDEDEDDDEDEDEDEDEEEVSYNEEREEAEMLLILNKIKGANITPEEAASVDGDDEFMLLLGVYNGECTALAERTKQVMDSISAFMQKAKTGNEKEKSFYGRWTANNAKDKIINRVMELVQDINAIDDLPPSYADVRATKKNMTALLAQYSYCLEFLEFEAKSSGYGPEWLRIQEKELGAQPHMGLFFKMLQDIYPVLVFLGYAHKGLSKEAKDDIYLATVDALKIYHVLQVYCDGGGGGEITDPDEAMESLGALKEESREAYYVVYSALQSVGGARAKITKATISHGLGTTITHEFHGSMVKQIQQLQKKHTQVESWILEAKEAKGPSATKTACNNVIKYATEAKKIARNAQDIYNDSLYIDAGPEEAGSEERQELHDMAKLVPELLEDIAGHEEFASLLLKEVDAIIAERKKKKEEKARQEQEQQQRRHQDAHRKLRDVRNDHEKALLRLHKLQVAREELRKNRRMRKRKASDSDEMEETEVALTPYEQAQKHNSLLNSREEYLKRRRKMQEKLQAIKPIGDEDFDKKLQETIKGAKELTREAGIEHDAFLFAVTNPHLKLSEEIKKRSKPPPPPGPPPSAKPVEEDVEMGTSADYRDNVEEIDISTLPEKVQDLDLLREESQKTVAWLKQSHDAIVKNQMIVPRKKGEDGRAPFTALDRMRLLRLMEEKLTQLDEMAKEADTLEREIELEHPETARVAERILSAIHAHALDAEDIVIGAEHAMNHSEAHRQELGLKRANTGFAVSMVAFQKVGGTEGRDPRTHDDIYIAQGRHLVNAANHYLNIVAHGGGVDERHKMKLERGLMKAQLGLKETWKTEGKEVREKMSKALEKML